MVFAVLETSANPWNFNKTFAKYHPKSASPKLASLHSNMEQMRAFIRGRLIYLNSLF